jgi:hypothetical protein
MNKTTTTTKRLKQARYLFATNPKNQIIPGSDSLSRAILLHHLLIFICFSQHIIVVVVVPARLPRPIHLVQAVVRYTIVTLLLLLLLLKKWRILPNMQMASISPVGKSVSRTDHVIARLNSRRMMPSPTST